MNVSVRSVTDGRDSEACSICLRLTPVCIRVIRAWGMAKSHHRMRQPPSNARSCWLPILLGATLYPLIVLNFPRLKEPPRSLKTLSLVGSALQQGSTIGTDVVMLVHFDRLMEGPFPQPDLVSRAVRSALTSTIGENGRVHVLSNHQQTLDILKPLNESGRLFLDDLRQRTSPEADEFRKHYRHQSINGPIYEGFCFWRWFVIMDYLQDFESQGRAVSRVLTIDTDILLVRPPSLLINHEWAAHWEYEEAVAVIPGGCVMWTMKGLRSWTQFMLSTYREEGLFKDRIMRYGIKMTCENSPKYGTTCEALKRACRAGNGGSIPCEDDDGLWHISDMMLQEGFFSEAPITRHHLHWQSPEQCETIGNVMYWRDHRIVMAEDGPILESNHKPLCLIHFQVSTGPRIHRCIGGCNLFTLRV